jgi:hypothetical protein
VAGPNEVAAEHGGDDVGEGRGNGLRCVSDERVAA